MKGIRLFTFNYAVCIEVIMILRYKNKNIFCFFSQSINENSIKLPKHWIVVH